MEKVGKFRVSIPLIVLGVVLLGLGASYPMVTLQIDDTPPVEYGHFPSAGDWNIAVKYLWVFAYDPESGVEKVTAELDGELYTLPLESGDPYTGANYKYFLETPITSGTHTVKYVVTNGIGLQTVTTATFTIIGAVLQGKWYINNIEITSATQIVTLTSRTVSFKFVKTEGPDDSKIKCSVWGEGIGTLHLNRTSPGIWEGEYTFEKGGTYTVTLQAYDGTNWVKYSIASLQIPTEYPDWLNLRTVLMVLGGALIAYGLFKRD